MNECTVQNRTLMLNGTGVRKVFMVEVYKAYLFSEQAVRRRDQVVQEEAAYRLSIHFSYGPISVERMRKAWRDAIENDVSGDELELEKEGFKQFFDSIKEYKKGDVVNYDMYRNQLAVYTNEELLCTISSKLVTEAVMDVLIGDHPIDENLKKGLLAMA